MKTRDIKVNCKIFLRISSVLLLLMAADICLVLFGYTGPSAWGGWISTLFVLLGSAFGLFSTVLCKNQITGR
jgi:hypothetical protein